MEEEWSGERGARGSGGGMGNGLEGEVVCGKAGGRKVYKGGKRRGSKGDTEPTRGVCWGAGKDIDGGRSIGAKKMAMKKVFGERYGLWSGKKLGRNTFSPNSYCLYGRKQLYLQCKE